MYRLGFAKPRTFLALLVIVGVGFHGNARACSCAAPPEDEREAVKVALADADLVFIGRIESTEILSAPEYGEGIQIQRATFLILRSWKGGKADRVHVESAATCCMCGYTFPKSGEFLVYARASGKDGYYSTSSCSRTKPIDEAKHEIELLDEARTRHRAQRL